MEVKLNALRKLENVVGIARELSPCFRNATIIEMLIEKEVKDMYGTDGEKGLYREHLKKSYREEYEEARSKKFGLVRYYLFKMPIYCLKL